MKTKLSLLATTGIITYLIIDFWKTKYDRIYRIAAEELLYEKTHHKK